MGRTDSIQKRNENLAKVRIYFSTSFPFSLTQLKIVNFFNPVIRYNLLRVEVPCSHFSPSHSTKMFVQHVEKTVDGKKFVI